MFKKICVIGLFVSIASYIFYPESEKHQYTVAITQIADHPSLDKIRKGIEETLKKNVDVKIIFQSAQGNMHLASQIAKKFVGENPDLIIPITTPSTQTVLAVSETIPVVFSAVSDPQSAKLTIPGVQDCLPIEKQVNLIRDFFPKAKRIGVLYNPGEANSVSMINQFKKHAKDFVVVDGHLNNPHHIAALVQSMRVDAFYIPNDNTAISHFQVILKMACNTPIFTSDPESVQKGALASLALDQYKIGAQTAQLAIRNLKGEKNVGIEKAKNIVLSKNKEQMKKYSIHIMK